MPAGRAGMMSKLAGIGATILRPNGTISAVGWTRTGGSTIHGVLSDQDDTTYMAPAGDPLDVNFDNTVLTTITSVTPKVRWRGFSGLGSEGELSDSFDCYLFLGGSFLLNSAILPVESGTITTWIGTTRTSKPGGGPWTPTDLNNIHMQIAVGDESGMMRFYELELSVVGT